MVLAALGRNADLKIQRSQESSAHLRLMTCRSDHVCRQVNGQMSKVLLMAKSTSRIVTLSMPFRMIWCPSLGRDLRRRTRNSHNFINSHRTRRLAPSYSCGEILAIMSLGSRYGVYFWFGEHCVVIDSGYLPDYRSPLSKQMTPMPTRLGTSHSHGRYGDRRHVETWRQICLDDSHLDDMNDFVRLGIESLT